MLAVAIPLPTPEITPPATTLMYLPISTTLSSGSSCSSPSRKPVSVSINPPFFSPDLKSLLPARNLFPRIPVPSLALPATYCYLVIGLVVKVGRVPIQVDIAPRENPVGSLKLITPMQNCHFSVALWQKLASS